MLALSFHAIFEGLAVGLEEEQHDVWTLFAGNLGPVFTVNPFHFGWYLPRILWGDGDQFNFFAVKGTVSRELRWELLNIN